MKTILNPLSRSPFFTIPANKNRGGAAHAAYNPAAHSLNIPMDPEKTQLLAELVEVQRRHNAVVRWHGVLQSVGQPADGDEVCKVLRAIADVDDTCSWARATLSVTAPPGSAISKTKRKTPIATIKDKLKTWRRRVDSSLTLVYDDLHLVERRFAARAGPPRGRPIADVELLVLAAKIAIAPSERDAGWRRRGIGIGPQNTTTNTNSASVASSSSTPITTFAHLRGLHSSTQPSHSEIPPLSSNSMPAGCSQQSFHIAAVTPHAPAMNHKQTEKRRVGSNSSNLMSNCETVSFNTPGWGIEVEEVGHSASSQSLQRCGYDESNMISKIVSKSSTSVDARTDRNVSVEDVVLGFGMVPGVMDGNEVGVEGVSVDDADDGVGGDGGNGDRFNKAELEVTVNRIPSRRAFGHVEARPSRSVESTALVRRRENIKDSGPLKSAISQVTGEEGYDGDESSDAAIASTVSDYPSSASPPEESVTSKHALAMGVSEAIITPSASLVSGDQDRAVGLANSNALTDDREDFSARGQETVNNGGWRLQTTEKHELADRCVGVDRERAVEGERGEVVESCEIEKNEVKKRRDEDEDSVDESVKSMLWCSGMDAMAMMNGMCDVMWEYAGAICPLGRTCESPEC